LNHEFLMEVIKERRSIRRYKKEPVPMEKLMLLVEAARWAPSAGNSQPWEFLLINDEDMVSALKAVSPGWLFDVPALMVVCINRERETDWSYFDVGAAMQNVLLCAHSLGLGCCPIGSFIVQVLRELLEIPEHLVPVLLITVGYPAEKPPATTRLSPEKLVFRRIGK